MATGGFAPQVAGAQHISELRIVLMGWSRAGKSSAGNTILGRQEFEANRSDRAQVTELLEKIEEMVAGNSGGCFEMNHGDPEKVEDPTSPEEEKENQELNTEMVTETRPTQRTSELRMVLLGLKNGGKSSAGNIILDKGDGFQVTELLEKVEELVARNGGSHYQMDRALSRVTDERIGLVEERAKQRLQNVREERERIRKIMGKAHVLPELRVREVAEAVKIEIKGLFAPRGLRSLSGAPPTFSGGSRHSESVTSYDELEEMIPHHLVRVFEWLNESGYKIKSSESGPASHDSDSGFIERDAFLNEIIGEKQEKRMQDLIEETATEDNNVAKNE
ncbi:hypothetical protein AGOR_G00189750 [Albula goreensis]|uniref:AIG1-type G domain-containing protein n=1 Tax=Albula goreensis TaxID=1534307 RepID=A0A8T3CVT1_9TELE|nr:hypothetical protein AGOR_G00189750 [Albula goreensis]